MAGGPGWARFSGFRALGFSFQSSGQQELMVFQGAWVISPESVGFKGGWGRIQRLGGRAPKPDKDWGD